MQAYLFLDRDGTLIVEPPDQQIDSLEKFAFVPGVISNLRRIVNELNFKLVMVSNQDGLGTSSFPEETFWPCQNLLLKTLKSEGVEFEEVLIDRSFPGENSAKRKPGTALLTHYLRGEIACDMAKSFVIGDRLSDLELARNLGCRAIHFSDGATPASALTTRSWDEIFNFLRSSRRTAQLTRKTGETEVTCKLALYGQGITQIETGIGFFDHMLTLLAFHAGMDLELRAQGDLNIDEHHTIEDVALCLGNALEQALADKRGIRRYGFVLPMDESKAEVLLDLSGRAKLVWTAAFAREKIGDFPCEMFKHFFDSFAAASKLCLHISVSGENEHHKAEAIFKALGRALRVALSIDPVAAGVPSSKGSI